MEMSGSVTWLLERCCCKHPVTLSICGIISQIWGNLHLFLVPCCSWRSQKCKCSVIFHPSPELFQLLSEVNHYWNLFRFSVLSGLLKGGEPNRSTSMVSLTVETALGSFDFLNTSEWEEEEEENTPRHHSNRPVLTNVTKPKWMWQHLYRSIDSYAYMLKLALFLPLAYLYSQEWD